MPYYAIVIFYHATPCHATYSISTMPYHDTPRHAMPNHTMPCNTMLHHAMSSHAASRRRKMLVEVTCVANPPRQEKASMDAFGPFSRASTRRCLNPLLTHCCVKHVVMFQPIRSSAHLGPSSSNAPSRHHHLIHGFPPRAWRLYIARTRECVQAPSRFS